MISLFEMTKEANQLSDGLYNDDRDGILLALFADIPDYSDKNTKDLWEKTFFEDDENVILFCKQNGIDVSDANNKVLSLGYDIAVMLKQGYKIKLEEK